MYGLAVLQEKDGKTFPLRRIGTEEGKKISPVDTSGLQFYHRVLSSVVEPSGGKGGRVYHEITYTMRLVAVGFRAKTTDSVAWNNEDIAKIALQILGSNPVLSGKELVLVKGQTVTDKMSVLNTEFAGNTEFNSRVLDLLAFAIQYTIKQKGLGASCIDLNNVLSSNLQAEL